MSWRLPDWENSHPSTSRVSVNRVLSNRTFSRPKAALKAPTDEPDGEEQHRHRHQRWGCPAPLPAWTRR